jgi:hypothetical protein
MSVDEKYRYIERLREPIEFLHKCRAYHTESVVVEEDLADPTTKWQRVVEVFSMVGHSDAKLCYAWTEKAANESCQDRFFCFLAGVAIDSPTTAVRARRNQN